MLSTNRRILAETAVVMPANLVNVTNVEIVQTGLEYPLKSGPHTFTVDELADCIASQDDPAIKSPRLKLGHTADLKTADGQPAVGILGNLRLEQEGHLIVGDYIGMPEWLANILPSAYPARSIEADLQVKTNTGHNWKMVLTDLALLGVVWPGCSTLEDIQALYSYDGPDGIRILSTKEEVEEVTGQPVAGSQLAAQIDVSEVARSYRESLDSGQMWWWIRSMMIEPNELIVEDEDKGDLYRVPFTVNGEEVNFSDPEPVKIEYVNKPQEKAKQAAARGKRTVAIFANREEYDMTTSAAGTASQNDVDPIALRNALGLDENASDEDVQTALAAAGVIPSPTAPPAGEPSGTGRAPAGEQPGTTESAAPPVPGQPDNQAPSGGNQNDPGTGEHTTPPPAGEGAGTVPPAVNAGSEVVTLDRATYERLHAGAEAGLRLDRESREQERDRIIGQAITDGKIPPSRKDHYTTAWNNDAEGTRTLLTATVDKGGLAPGLVPVVEAGGVRQQDDLTVEAYPAEWLPEIQREG